MTAQVVLAHMPLLRIEETVLPFASGCLWRMPFEAFDDYTLGAWSEQGKDYEATAPVFYKVEAEDWEYHLNRLWIALTLAAPAAALPNPRLSFIIGAEEKDAGFEQDYRVITSHSTIQGDADLEYLFMAELASPPLPAEVIARAQALLPTLDKAEEYPDLAGAVNMLLSASSPPLTPAEQLTLAVIALEALLLPEVMSGLGSTFARRLSALLGVDEGQRTALKKTARKLYGYRSASVHGGPSLSASEAPRTIAHAYAQQILAASVTAITAQVGEQLSLEALRGQLDRAVLESSTPAAQPVPQSNSQVQPLPLQDPPGLRQLQRLLRQRASMVMGFHSGADMTAHEGEMLSWSPLIGLRSADIFALDRELRILFMPLDGNELLAMEERDIVRDFASELHMLEEPMAVFTTRRSFDGYFIEDRDAQPVLRQRDLVVCALRMAGYKAFVDPELLGWFIYHGKMRHRRPTVYRQTILTMARMDVMEEISTADQERLIRLWELLWEYETKAPSGEVDHILNMFRRSFDRRFVPGIARAGLQLAALEAMLGKFRKREDPIQLEHLVLQIVGEHHPAAAWFNNQGRSFRNAVAHGYWDPSDDSDPTGGLKALEDLQDLLCTILPAFIRSWVDSAGAGQRPGAAFIAQASRQVQAQRKK